MYSFQGTTADEVWLKAARTFIERGSGAIQESRAGGTIELMGSILEIQNPLYRWTLSRKPALNPAFALAEVVWILQGREDAKFLNFWNPKLPQFAGNTRKYHGAYGRRLRRAHGVDQLNLAYSALQNNEATRQVVLQIWRPAADLPKQNGQANTPDIPCNVCGFLKVRDGKLEWTQIMRSNDLILGMPHNFVQFTMLQEIIAGWLGLEVGSYRHYADSLHIYEKDFHYLEDLQQTQLSYSPSPIRLTKQESDQQFGILAKRMVGMLKTDLTTRNLNKLVYSNDISPQLTDWLRIVGADCARRKGWVDLALELGHACKEPALSLLWNRWYERRLSVERSQELAVQAVADPQMYLPLVPAT